ncbi:MAG TPA: MFS transporter [Pirellulales bacterium]|nr:MFS transporter [Pirellulales bacterium]
MSAARTRWYHELTRYHWFVLAIAALGWLFDCLDQQLFTLSRQPALTELLTTSDGIAPSRDAVQTYSGYVTSIFLIGWATGGLTFGVLGDRIGRARTMLWTILIYSLFTGLSAFSAGFWDFAFYRFLTGLGVGGEFAVGVALVAEVMPSAARPFALALLQALSGFGNGGAAVISMGLGELELRGVFEHWTWPGSNEQFRVWRLMYLIGVTPALLAVVIRRRLKEPEKWQAVAADATAERRLGSYRELFGNPRWARNAIVGVLLASSGVIGLWAVGFFTPELIRSVLSKTFEDRGMSKTEISGILTFWTGVSMVMFHSGASLGMFSFGYLTYYVGRRPAFAMAFVSALLSTASVFWYLDTYAEIFWMVPLMGFCQLSLFSGYAIYFPELFPTYLRSTGTSFCYNVGRFVAAGGPLMLGYLTSQVFAGQAEPLRYAGVALSSVFLLGLLVLPFAPETRGRSLPE